MQGALELKTLLLLPAVMAGSAAVPGADDADPQSLLMRWSLIACALGGYVMTCVEWASRKPGAPAEDMAERVIGAIARWAASGAVGWVCTVAAFDYWKWPVTIWQVLLTGFVLAMIGWQLAIWALPRLLKRGKRVVGGLIDPSPQPDSDPPA